MKTTLPPGPRPLDDVPVALRRFTKLTAAWAAFVIFAGAQVTSTGSGLAVPDWPLSYGMFFPPMVGGIFYEHGHRLVAGTFGVLTLIQAIWIQWAGLRPGLKKLGWALLGTTIFQGLLGGLTVKLLLPKPVSVSHGLVAEIAFCIAVSTAFFVSRFYRDLQSLERGDAPIGLTTALVVAVFLQVFAGAVMRHRGAGLAIPDFPLAFGRLVPPFANFDVVINYTHRLGALAVAVLVVITAARLLRFAKGHPLRELAMILLAVVTGQLVLGAYTIWTAKQPIVTSFHVMNGAITLALSVVIALTARTIGWRVEDRRPRLSLSSVKDYLALSKARIVMMVLITTAAGYVFAAPHVNWVLLVNTLIGTALVAAGTNALNQYVERDHDAKMRRTKSRPLPDGRLTPRAALVFSAAVAILGTAYLIATVNLLTAILGALTLTSYIFVYTPLKRISTICTVIGAVPGAIPPLMGWTAATGHLGIGGWILFGILFFWQLPHFMAISWMYREDYGRAGFAMTAVRDADGTATARQAILYSIALLAVSALPPLFALAGLGYLAGALLSGLVLTAAAIKFFLDRSNRNARQLFMLSNVYLVVVMLLLVI